jgi:hypothetical protein
VNLVPRSLIGKFFKHPVDSLQSRCYNLGGSTVYTIDKSIAVLPHRITEHDYTVFKNVPGDQVWTKKLYCRTWSPGALQEQNFSLRGFFEYSYT